MPVNFDPSAAFTNLLYSGEIFDQRIEMQYLRARYYDPASGTFNRLDPFAGNTHDPRSLHKYLYVHGDPIQGMDPTGLFTAKQIGVSMGINAMLAGSLTAAYGAAKGWSLGKIATYSAINAGIAALTTLGYFGIAWGLAFGTTEAVALTCAGLIIAPTTLGLALSNFEHAMRGDDPVEKVFATIDLSLAVYGTMRLGIDTGRIPARERAHAAAVAERLAVMKNELDRGAAGAMLLNGDPFPARSTRAGGRSQPIEPQVQVILDGMDTIARSRYHGSCVEPRSASSIIAEGSDPRGAWSAVVRVSDGARLRACSSCRTLLKELGVKDAYEPDYEPLYFLITSLFSEGETSE